jgi:hypothetical protein
VKAENDILKNTTGFVDENSSGNGTDDRDLLYCPNVGTAGKGNTPYSPYYACWTYLYQVYGCSTRCPLATTPHFIPPENANILLHDTVACQVHIKSSGEISEKKEKNRCVIVIHRSSRQKGILFRGGNDERCLIPEILHCLGYCHFTVERIDFTVMMICG